MRPWLRNRVEYVRHYATILYASTTTLPYCMRPPLGCRVVCVHHYATVLYASTTMLPCCISPPLRYRVACVHHYATVLYASTTTLPCCMRPPLWYRVRCVSDEHATDCKSAARCTTANTSVYYRIILFVIITASTREYFSWRQHVVCRAFEKRKLFITVAFD